MSEHDNTDPVEPVPVAADQPAAVTPEPPAPAAEAQPRWRDRVFRMRAVAAVAVAGVILGAAGGAVTVSLVSDHGDRGDHHRIGQQFGPGVPMMVPPGGRQRFPGDESEDGGLPEMPIPPGSEDGTEGETDGGTAEESSLSRS